MIPKLKSEHTEKYALNLNYTFLGLLMCHNFFGWGWTLSIVEWTFNILCPIMIVANIFIGLSAKSMVVKALESGREDVLVAILQKQPLTLQTFVNYLLLVFFIYYFFNLGLLYTASVIVLSSVMAHVVRSYMRSVIIKVITKE